MTVSPLVCTPTLSRAQRASPVPRQYAGLRSPGLCTRAISNFFRPPCRERHAPCGGRVGALTRAIAKPRRQRCGAEQLLVDTLLEVTCGVPSLVCQNSHDEQARVCHAVTKFGINSSCSPPSTAATTKFTAAPAPLDSAVTSCCGCCLAGSVIAQGGPHAGGKPSKPDPVHKVHVHWFRRTMVSYHFLNGVTSTISSIQR